MRSIPEFRRITISAFALGMSLLSVAGCQEEAAPPLISETPRNVRVMALTKGTINEYFEISGPVAPVRGTDLSAQEAGPVVAITAAKGTRVEAGEVIVEQDRAILKAEMAAAKAAYETQSYNVDKIRQLHEADKVSRIELLKAEGDYEQARSRAEVAAERFRRAAITAPFAGVVADRFVELGELAAPGMRMVRLIDPFTLKLEAYLTEEQIGWVEVGGAATVLLGDESTPASGTISWVGFEADRLTGKFKVEIELGNDDLKLRSGVIGRARLGKTVLNDVVSIPRDAVLAGGGENAAFVVVGDRAERRRITLGASQGLMVQVTAGLAMGDQLVVRGQRDLRDGSLVRVTETAATPDGAIASDPTTVTAGETGSRVPAGHRQAAVEDQ